MTNHPAAEHPLAAWIAKQPSQRDAAERLGISASHLSLLLAGKRGMSFDLAERAQVLAPGELDAAGLLRQHKAFMAQVADTAEVSP